MKTLTDGLHVLTALLEQNSLEECKTQFEEVKHLLVTKNILFAEGSNLLPIIQIMETGAYLFLLLENIDGFVSCFSVLKSGYYSHESKSQNTYKLVGIEMLRCLAIHNHIRFGEIMEELPYDVLMNNKDVGIAIILSQHISEGNFGQAIRLCSSLTNQEYVHLGKMLIYSIREEMATCFESAYPSLNTSETQKMLFYPTDLEFQSLVSKHAWKIEHNSIVFKNPSEVNTEPQAKITEKIRAGIDIIASLEKVV